MGAVGGLTFTAEVKLKVSFNLAGHQPYVPYWSQLTFVAFDMEGLININILVEAGGR